jgi:hypothetical protein
MFMRSHLVGAPLRTTVDKEWIGRADDVDAAGLLDWVPDDHLVWSILGAVEQMDLSAFYGAYRENGQRRAAYEPTSAQPGAGIGDDLLGIASWGPVTTSPMVPTLSRLR